MFCKQANLSLASERQTVSLMQPVDIEMHIPNVGMIHAIEGSQLGQERPWISGQRMKCEAIDRNNKSLECDQHSIKLRLESTNIYDNSSEYCFHACRQRESTEELIGEDCHLSDSSHMKNTHNRKSSLLL